MFSNSNSFGNICCIPHCVTNEARHENSGVQFYPFPTDPILKEMWMERVRKAGNGNRWRPDDSCRLCGIHFSSTGSRDSCDILPRYFGSKVYPHSGIICMDEVQVKLEVTNEDDIEIHEEPLVEEFSDFTNTEVKQEPMDFVDTSEIPKTESEEVEYSFSPHNNQNSLMMSLANIEEKISLIKRDKPPIFSEMPTKKKRVIKWTQMASDDNNQTLENENLSLKRQISVLEQSLAKANSMIKERKEIIMNLVKEINKLKQQSSAHDALKTENAHLQDSLTAANRRINEEKELIVNLTIENINLKKNGEIEFHRTNFWNDQLAKKNKLVETLNEEKQTLCEEIDRLRKENERLVNKHQLEGNLYHSNKIIRVEQKLAVNMKELESYKSLLKSQSHWSEIEIKYYTGFAGKSEFKAFCDIAKTIDSTPVSESYNISKVRQQIFITLSRIRQGLSVEDLSTRFDMSTGTIDRILNHWQCVLSDSSFNWKICHSYSVIIKFFFEYFQEKHKRKIMCYFVGISPFGYVIFVSNLFAPSMNRMEVLKTSGILSLLDERFTVVALDTNEFSDLGIELLASKPEEVADFLAHCDKLILNVRKNKLFSHVLPTQKFSDIDVSNAWKISWYLQNYTEES